MALSSACSCLMALFFSPSLEPLSGLEKSRLNLQRLRVTMCLSCLNTEKRTYLSCSQYGLIRRKCINEYSSLTLFCRLGQPQYCPSADKYGMIKDVARSAYHHWCSSHTKSCLGLQERCADGGFRGLILHTLSFVDDNSIPFTLLS